MKDVDEIGGTIDDALFLPDDERNLLPLGGLGGGDVGGAGGFGVERFPFAALVAIEIPDHGRRGAGGVGGRHQAMGCVLADERLLLRACEQGAVHGMIDEGEGRLLAAGHGDQPVGAVGQSLDQADPAAFRIRAEGGRHIISTDRHFRRGLRAGNPDQRVAAGHEIGSRRQHVDAERCLRCRLRPSRLRRCRKSSQSAAREHKRHRQAHDIPCHLGPASIHIDFLPVTNRPGSSSGQHPRVPAVALGCRGFPSVQIWRRSGTAARNKPMSRP